MSIVAMKKLRLIGARSRKAEILRQLMLMGCVEISAPRNIDEDDTESFLKLADTGRASKKRADRTMILNALKQLNRYVPYSKGLLTPLPEIPVETLLDESGLNTTLETAERILALDVQIRSISAQESRERSTLESMTPWVSLDRPMDFKGTETCDFMLGSVPATVPMESLSASIDEADLEACVTEVSVDKGVRYLSAVYTKGLQEQVSSCLRQYGFTQISMVGVTGTAKENIASAEESLKKLAVEKEAKIDLLKAEAPNREELQLGVDTLNTVIAREEASEKLLQSKSTFYFEGWVIASEEKRLGEILDEYGCAWETEEPDKEHPEEVPVKLKNNPLTEPYNMVTEMYSLPAYNGIDPNPFIMPFFALFFGIMFADMAYGLILLVAGILFKTKAKPRGTMKYMAGLLIECGITTFLMGFLTGGFFGDAVSVIGKWFGKEWNIVPYLGSINIGDISISLPINLLEGNNPLYVLIAAIVLGAVHLAVGVGIGMYLKIKDGEWADALLNDLCWWVIIAGIGVMVLAGSKIVLWIGLGMMVLGSLITNKGFGKITGIFSAIYNGATGYLGDFLSYSRLMALMLAGSVIASVFNQLGALGNADGFNIGGLLLFIVVFIIGHALNFGLNIIGCFVHTLRLQYLEFFGKWYRDGGKAFKPLKIDTKFYEINNNQ